MTTVDLGRLPRGQDGQLVIGNTGKSPLWKTVSGDATLSAAGALTLSSGFQSTQTAWTAYTPSVQAGVGALNTATATGRYKQIGKTIFIQIDITIVSNGTGSSYIGVSVPFGLAQSCVIPGREDAVTGHMLQARPDSASSLLVVKYDNSYPGGDGYVLHLTGVYETT